MQRTQLIAGILSLGLAAVLYILGYTNYDFMIQRTHVLVYPAAFFALAGLVLLFWATRDLFRVADN